MNILSSKFLRSAYRKEPISSFVIAVSAVDAVIGGVDRSWSLLTVALLTMGGAFAWRWWQIQRFQEQLPEEAPQYFLTPQSSRPPLPMLNPSSKRQPPR